jgi:acyl transferase domain-containing protein/NAD(P)H-dependent flavin oxidoreductase YrpB (nitropropane dioxygenase family)
VLDLGFGCGSKKQGQAVEALASAAGESGHWGVAWRWLPQAPQLVDAFEQLPHQPWPWLVISGLDFRSGDAPRVLAQGKKLAQRVLAEVYSARDAVSAADMGFDGLILKGLEAGGKAGEQSTFLLLQRVHDKLKVPYWVRGGIGPETAAAAVMAGATGVVLGEQLWLAAESPMSDVERSVWRRLDGSETRLLSDGALGYRFFARSGRTVLENVGRQLETGGPWLAMLHDAFLRSDTGGNGDDALIPLGEEIAFAADLSRRFRSVGGILGAFRRAMRENLTLARDQKSLAAHASLAERLQSEFPVVQGPMSRVSDVPAFGQAVSQAGALPVFALGLSRKAEVERLLKSATAQLGDRAWGIGLLGFIPGELRSEQWEAVRAFHPTHAVIAGGQPEQAMALAKQGIKAYLHAPSPGLLEAFTHDGATRFILEGRECGGHVGPRSSFTLWQSAVDVLRRLVEDGVLDDLSEFEILFAGGIHDRLSAAMAAAIAAPLVALGAKIGLLIGTAYLFTREAVASGAIVEEFQRQILACERTTLLESGLGHASRCLDTPFAAEFRNRKRELSLSETPPEQVRFELELLNLGRLRIASKGVKRTAADGEPRSRLAPVSEKEQQREGMYMIGEAATLITELRTMKELHHDLCSGSVALLENLAPPQPAAQPARDRRNPVKEPIAIIGMSCLFPQSADLRAYWRNIFRKFNAVTEVPPDRWRAETFYSPDRAADDRVYSKWGAFLGETHFDPFRYAIPPASLNSVEPVQLLSLEVARRALEDAGYFGHSEAGRQTAVIFAVGGPHEVGMAYGFRTMLRNYLAEAVDLPEDIRERVLKSLGARLPRWTEDSFAGFLNNVIAGRISNQFDLMGPNFVVDAACAASLAAVHVAVEQLRLNACDAALVGAVDATNSPMAYMSFAKTQALSPRGKSCPLDQSADGIVLGEGLAVLMLKRLTDAECDGDRIYAVIRGIGAGSDGRHRSLTAPHPEGQLCTLQRAYEDAQLSPARVSLIECHGTGTVVGDQAEIEALQQLFQTASPAPHSCAVGSVKSMIGHTKTVAGLAGLVKTVLALKQRVLPPTTNVERPNAQLEAAALPFYVNTEPRPWVRLDASQPRCAGVSAFGFGGTNFHAVLEEYEGTISHSARPDFNPRAVEIFSWSAPDRASLLSHLESFSRRWRDVPDADLAQAAFSLLHDQQMRSSQVGVQHRLAIVARDEPALRKAMQLAQNTIRDGVAPAPTTGVYYGDLRSSRAEPICFVFPGQGAQRVNMLKELLFLHPHGIDLLEKADQTLRDFFEQPLSRLIYPPPVFDDEQRRIQEQALTDARVAPAALTVMALLAQQMLHRHGLHPDFVAGHSHGEWIALGAGGCLTEDELLRLSASRGKAIWEASRRRPGSMAAVFADAPTTQSTLRALEIPAHIANYNAPQQTIIAGDVEVIARAIEQFPMRGVNIRSIPVAAAFHTSAMEPAAESLAPELRRISFSASQTPVFSNATCEPYPPNAEGIRELLLRQFTSPVRFVDEIRALYVAGARVFIEAGPGNIASANIDRILDGQPHAAIPLDLAGVDAAHQFARLLARCYTLGLPVTFEPWFTGRGLTVDGVDAYFESQIALREKQTKQWIIGPHRIRSPQERANAVQPLPPASASAPAMRVAETPSQSGAGQPSQNALFNARRTMNPSRPTLSNGHHQTANESPAPAMAAATTETPIGARIAQSGAVASVASGSQDALVQLQQNLAGWLELQKISQHASQQFLEVQSQLIHLLSGNEVRSRSTPTPRAMSFASPSMAQAPAPPAPVLPLLPAGRFTAAAPQPAVGAISSRAASNGRATTQAVPATPTTAPSPGPPAIVSVEEFRTALLEATSRRTGYPVEMLQEDLLLEADLGIDSIKRIEILKDMKGYLAFAESKQRSENEMVTLFTKLRTLGDLIENFRQERAEFLAQEGESGDQAPATAPSVVTTQAPQPVNPTIAAPAAADHQPVQRFVLKLTPQRLEGEAPQQRLLPPGRSFLVLGEAPPAIDLSRLTVAGDVVCHVTPGAAAAKRRANGYQADFGNPASLAELHGLLAMDGHRIGGLVNLLGLAERFDRPRTPEGDDALELALETLNCVKEFGKELQESLVEGGVRLVNVTSLGGDFGIESQEPLPLSQTATLGLFKTLSTEWRGARVTTIDIDPLAEPETIRTQLAAEILNRNSPLEVGLHRDGRWIIELADAPLKSESAAGLHLDAQSVVLVTGGGRGITAEAARALAAKYGCQFVVVGRTPEPAEEESPTRDLPDEASLRQHFITMAKQEEEIPLPSEIDRRVRTILKDRELRHNLADLRKLASRLEYRAVDVSQTAGFGSLIDETYQHYGKIDVVIHGAGVIEDRWIHEKTVESFTRIFRTKVDSANVLARRLRPESLQRMVFYSSTASRFGNVGQSDYAAANEYLNKLADDLNRRWTARVVAIQWGPWNGGMVDAALAEHCIRSGLSLIPIADGVKAFLAECQPSEGSAEVVIGCDVLRMADISRERRV